MRTVVDEIARGYATDTLRAELQASEQRKRALVAELEALTGRKQAAASLDVERLRRELRRHVAEIRGTPRQGHPADAADTPAVAGGANGMRGVR